MPASAQTPGTPNLKLRRMVEPIYPPEAQRDGIRGTVVVEVLIDQQGVPLAIHTVRGDSILAEAVSRAVQQWRWEPYRLKRKAVAVEMTLAVNFDPASHTAAVF
ncbi:MAG TPA: energy transducer TonB [Candidatus Angelobacter sp.]